MKTLTLSALALTLTPFAFATEIATTYSEDFAEKLVEDYGEKEGEKLQEIIGKDLTRNFEKAGIAPERVDIVILDAKPNRPTFKQLRDEPGLDGFRSISIGGMELQGTAYNAEGEVVATYTYDWFENNLRDVVGSSTWSDARRASKRFAKNFAEELGS